jgi:hypothetical protein
MSLAELESLLTRINEKTHWGLIENCPDWTKIGLRLGKKISGEQTIQRENEIEAINPVLEKVVVPAWFGTTKILR